jgi:hypothetical protein
VHLPSASRGVVFVSTCAGERDLFAVSNAIPGAFTTEGESAAGDWTTCSDVF